MLGEIRLRLFGISPSETSIARRGFSVTDPVVQVRLETIGQTFVQGYHAALQHPGAHTLATTLNHIEPELRGFAYEGAGMGLALLDTLAPWRTNYVRNFVQGLGEPHAYMIQIGVGWAAARLKRPARGWLNRLDRLDPVTKWLMLDGYGFHEAYFDWQHVIGQQAIPNRLTGYERRGFDQGVGRALWFVQGADVGRIQSSVGAFATERHNDLWSGIGLACAYAGGVCGAQLEALKQVAGADRHALAQGVVFATKTRQRAANPAPHTDMACRLICMIPPAEAAKLFDVSGHNLPLTSPQPAFEIWRQRIQSHFLQPGNLPADSHRADILAPKSPSPAPLHSEGASA